MPASSTTASANCLPCSYWRSFTSKPSRRSMIRCGAERLRRRRSIAARSSSWSGISSAAMRIHHVLGVPLDHRHGRLNLIHQCPLFGVLHKRSEPTLPERLDQTTRIRQRRQPARRATLDPDLQGGDVAAQQPAHVLAQPGHALELEHVRQLVRADPAAERVRVHVEVTHGARQVLADEQEARLGVAAQQGHVVLPEHPRGQVAHHQAGLGGDGGRGADPKRAGERPREREAVVQAGGDGVEDAATASRGSPRPTRPGSPAPPAAWVSRARGRV